jgi:uncharacterized protein involved in response to NO
MVPAYIFILGGALLRVVVPTAWPQYTHWGIALAGVFWVLAYGIFIIYYGPMLLAPRADGRPG